MKRMVEIDGQWIDPEEICAIVSDFYDGSVIHLKSGERLEITHTRPGMIMEELVNELRKHQEGDHAPIS